MERSRLTGPRIVCVGCNLESEIALAGLIERGAHVAAVVTRPAGDPGAVCDYADLHDVCRAANIPTIETTDINSTATLAALHAVSPDYIYTLGWSQLFRGTLLAIPQRYVVGSHPSALPFGRGRAPVPWTILQDLRRSAVTLFRMEPDADAGKILVQQWFDVPPDAYAGEVYQLVAGALRDAYCSLYEAHRTGRELAEIAQSPAGATHRAKRTPADGHIDFRRPAAEIARLVRAVAQPYPGAYTYYGTGPAVERVVIWRATLDDVPNHVGAPGQILVRSDDRLLVQAGDRPLWCWDFSIGGQPAATAEFRVGCKFGLAVEDELVRLRRELYQLQATLERLGLRDRVKEVA